MRLSLLLDGVDVSSFLNFSDIDILGISTDSREVEKGFLFAAVKGTTADGHDYIDEAVRRGASALLVEREVDSVLPTVVVRDSAEAVALAAKRFYGNPSGRMVLCGVTGTNGKTSTSFLLRSILNEAVGPAGIIGTVGFGYEDTMTAATHTTPASVDLERILAEFLERGCRSAVMEVSSHATVQKRIAGLEFDVGVFTNITRDHLDYHGTMENYIAAKELFAGALVEPKGDKAPGIMVYNMEDEHVSGIAGRFDGKKVSFGTNPEADVRAENVVATLNETSFRLVHGEEAIDVHLNLLGGFSIMNGLAAAAAAVALNIDMGAIKRGLEKVAEVPGRFQVVSRGEGPVVIVDYAHTPDALERLLRFCRELSPKKLITVFGCGGDRDRGKRPLMGRISYELSDLVIVTDDNPRTEDPERIVEEILAGMPSAVESVKVIRDRREAIHRAVEEARDGDIVAIAGKGHETEQIVGTKRIHFSDVEVAREAFERLGK